MWEGHGEKNPRRGHQNSWLLLQSVRLHQWWVLGWSWRFEWVWKIGLVLALGGFFGEWFGLSRFEWVACNAFV